MPIYQTPGVYYERVDASAPGIAALRTDVAGFVGIAERGPLHTAVPVQSWRQFQAYFGDFTGAGFLAYAVRAFFENGGRRCRVVRVASDLASIAEITLRSASHNDIWRIAAYSPGVWGNDLEITLQETHRAQTLTDPRHSAPEYAAVASITGFRRGIHVRLSQDGATTLWKVVSDVDAVASRLIWLHEKPEARLPYDAVLTGFNANWPVLIESVEYTLLVRELGRLIRVYEGLSLVPEHPRYGPYVLASLVIAREPGQLQTLPAAPEPVVIQELRALPLTSIEPLAVSPDVMTPLTGGADGLALLRVYDFIGEGVDPRVEAT
jgi:hypothetical protein